MTAIVALGARTALGLNAASTAAAFRCGMSRFEEHPFMLDLQGEPIKCCLDARLDPKRLGSVRLLTMARSALQQVLAQLKLPVESPPRLRVLLALPESRPGFTDAQATWVARELTSGLLTHPAELASRGHAGSLDAVGHAATILAQGDADLCAIVGVDSYFAPDTIDWLMAERRLAGKENRDGFVPGEAAGCIVLASPWARSALQLPLLATVRGAQSAREASTVTGDAEVLGRGLTHAVEQATAPLRLPLEAVDDLYADLNGERYRSDELGFVFLRAGAAFRSVRYRMVAASLGDVGAASGVLGCIMAVRSWARDYADGPRALVVGGSDSGLRAAVVLERGQA